MISSIAVIAQVGAGGRPLLRTADSLARQRQRAADVLLVKSRLAPAPALVASIVARLDAVIVEPGSGPAAALNDAVRRTAAPYFAVVPAGYVLQPACLERLGALMDADAALAALAPSVQLQTPDGLGAAEWVPEGTSPAVLLTDPRSAPSVFVVRRSAWEAAGGFDESLSGLVEYEFWLRLAAQPLRVIAEPLVIHELQPRGSAPPVDDEYLSFFRAVLTRHEDAVRREMTEVLIAREVRFGRLREIHRELITRRDEDLATLEQLRAETAHNRAYLAHHGRAAVDWGDLRRTDPLSRDWGYDRGAPIDRRYIDEFLAAHSSDIHGAVLEIQEDDFTRAFGGPRVTERAVLDIDAANPRATMLADLRAAPEIPPAHFDCLILTQTLHVVDDMPAMLRECYRILKPGGVLLATLPSASRVCLEYGEHGDLWRTTPAGARALFDTEFVPAQTSCDVFGNVLTNTAFLQGFACAEVTDEEFAAKDPYYPALTGVRARKSAAPSRGGARGVVLLYHRVDETADVHQLGVPHALFDAHLQWLRAECHLMPLDRLLSAPPEELPDRAVALTFDDGYLDNLTAAAPLLQRHGVPATFFLTSRWLDAEGEYWWDALERSLLGGAAVPAALDLDIAGRRERHLTAAAEDRLALHWRLHDVLVHAPLAERDRIVEVVTRWSGSSRPRVRPMVADEARALAAMPGMTIGAHTVNHLALPDQTADARDREIADASTALGRVIGRPVDLFAYPYGALDRSVAAAVRAACRWGLSCEEATLGDSFDAARVPRLDVKPWPAGELAARVERLFRRDEPRPARTVTLRPA